ncbi:peripheral plastid protein 1, putative [Plasmodium ovale curtisi]|uniref:Peripheral plastid protein 1, putative n=1 Tax=Plasmodium ovale curtisi TaxID=864141 RepID=A0A1A8WWR4_PLAOA|nr:peripheral plastid protein 1, putative [Plasmodium ovale curtisi]
MVFSKNIIPFLYLLFHLFILNTYLSKNSEVWKTSKFPRRWYDKRGKKFIQYSSTKEKNGMKEMLKKHAHLSVHSYGWRKRVSYKVNKYKVCSIFSPFGKKQGKKGQNGVPSPNGVLITQNGKNTDKGERRVPPGDSSKVDDIPNGERSKNENCKHDKNTLSPSKKTEIANMTNSREVRSNAENQGETTNMEKNIPVDLHADTLSDLCSDIRLDVRTTPGEALKSTETYRKHLQRVKNAMTIGLGEIFFAYAKGIEKKEGFRSFFDHILKNFENSYNKITYIDDLECMKDEEKRGEYIRCNYNTFIEIVNMIEEHLFHILTLKVNVLKVQALGEIKDVLTGRERKEDTQDKANRESSTNGMGTSDYISFMNSIGSICTTYEQKLKELCPLRYEFQLYRKIRDKEIFLVSLTYELPAEKYEHFIKKNIEYVKLFSHDLTKKKKRNLFKEIEKNKNYNNILQIIDNQQKQIELLQEQLESSIEGMHGKYSPFNCAIAYRIPDTNMNLSTQYVKGKFNIKLNCIPDDSLHLLGSYGFVKSLPFGNLGLSFSLNF